MNIEKLREATLKLRTAINSLADSDPAAKRLGLELEPLMLPAERGQIHTAVQWRDIPGNYLFTEEGLQQYPALESAFSRFCIELTGGETDSLRWLREQMGDAAPSKPQ